METHCKFEEVIRKTNKSICDTNDVCINNFGKSNVICIKHILSQKINIFESIKKSRRKIKIKINNGKFIKIVKK